MVVVATVITTNNGITAEFFQSKKKFVFLRLWS